MKIVYRNLVRYAFFSSLLAISLLAGCAGDQGPIGPAGRNGSNSSDQVTWMPFPDNGAGATLDSGITPLPFSTFEFNKLNYPNLDSISMEYIISAFDSSDYVELFNVTDNKSIEGTRISIPGKAFGGLNIQITTKLSTTANLNNTLPPKLITIQPRIYKSSKYVGNMAVRSGKFILYRKKIFGSVD